jgi:hypothetical protein
MVLANYIFMLYLKILAIEPSPYSNNIRGGLGATYAVLPLIAPPIEWGGERRKGRGAIGCPAMVFGAWVMAPAGKGARIRAPEWLMVLPH